MAAPVDGPGDTKSTPGWQGATAESLRIEPEMPILSLMIERPSPEWRISDQPVSYEEALAAMEARVAEIRAGRARELVWLLEHPPLYTAGTSARAIDLLQPVRFPVHAAGRGGQYTYHGPGQRVVYVMLDLRQRKCDVRRFVFDLEEWTIRALARFNVRAERRPGRVGVWVARPEKPPALDGAPREEKIAAIGVRIRHWVSFHGISINVEPDLSHYDGIVPCGIAEHGVTSLVDLGLPVTLADLDDALQVAFDEVFGEPLRPSAAA
jgi:lipoyl(octanoyl) transferase